MSDHVLAVGDGLRRTGEGHLGAGVVGLRVGQILVRLGRVQVPPFSYRLIQIGAVALEVLDRTLLAAVVPFNSRPTRFLGAFMIMWQAHAKTFCGGGVGG